MYIANSQIAKQGFYSAHSLSLHLLLSSRYPIASIVAIANATSNPGDVGVGFGFSSPVGGAVGVTVGVGFAIGVAAGFAVSPGANVGVGLGVTPAANVGVGVGVPSDDSADAGVTDHVQVCILDKPVSVLVAIADKFQVPAATLVFV